VPEEAPLEALPEPLGGDGDRRKRLSALRPEHMGDRELSNPNEPMPCPVEGCRGKSPRQEKLELPDEESLVWSAKTGLKEIDF
jgi:hypothetical protein